MTVLAASRFSLPRWAVRFGVLAAGTYLLFSFAAYVAVGSLPHAAIIGCLGLVPVAAYIALRWPIYFPFALYAIVVPLEPLVRTNGGVGASLTKFASYAVILAFAARILLIRRAFLPPSAWLAWGAFTFFAVASVGWTVYEPETFRAATVIVQLFLFYTVGALYPMSAIDAVRLRRVIEIAGVAIAAYGLCAYVVGQRMDMDSTRLSLREGNITMDPNHYAATFILPMALLMARFLTDRRTIVKMLSAVAFAVCALNIFYTGSRGVFIGIACMLAYLAIRTRNYVATALMTVVFLGISAAVPNTWQRFADPTQSDASGRTDIWTVGLHAFPHYWLHGAGFATSDVVYDLYLMQSYQRKFQGWDRPSHSLLLGTAVELGVIGLALVLFAWFWTIRQTWNVRADHPAAPLAYGAEAACLGLFVTALSLDMLWFKYLWLALMVSAMAANAIRGRTVWAPRDAHVPSALPTPAPPRRSERDARYAGF